MAGQAMTEFVIAAAFVLIPIFLIYPLIGKYIDMKHSAVQSARYIAWERTVWHENSPRDSGAPIKNKNRLESEATRRLLSRTDLSINSRDYRGWQADDRNTLWRDHRNNELLQQYSDIKPEQQNQKNTPALAYRAIGAFNRAMNIIYTPLRALGVSNDPTFFTIAHSTRAFYEPHIEIDVSNIVGLDGFNELDLTMRGQAAILADGWTAANSTQFNARTRDFVPSTLLNNPALDAFKTIATTPIPIFGVSMAPELDGLNMGHIGTRPAGAGKPNCSRGGNNFNACEY